MEDSEEQARVMRMGRPAVKRDAETVRQLVPDLRRGDR